jgi:hypothetical protein
MSELYAIVDLDGYATQMREAAAKSISDSNTDNLDDYISLKQMIGLVNERCKGFDEENRPLLDEASNELVFEDAAIWIHEVGLAKLAAQDLVECAWDDESNEMIFWRKETKESTQNAKPKSRRKNKKSEG